jgi:hypothetical protein
MTANMTNFASTLKEIWADGVEVPLYENNPAFAMVPKSEDWDGDIFNCVIDVGGMNGVSSTFSDAKGNKGASQPLAFQIDTRDRFAVWGIDHKLTVLSRNQRGAVVQALAYETKKAMTRLGCTWGQIIHGDGGGSIGRIATGGITASTITLQNPDDVRNFEPGDQILLSANDGTAGAHVLKAGGPLIVQSVDFDLGTVTFTAGVVATVATAVALDFVFREGDFKLVPAGFEGWNPLVIPGTPWYGMTRTTYGVRQAGWRRNATAITGMANKIKFGLTYAYRAGAKHTHIFMRPDDFNTLEGELGTVRRYVDTKVATVGFTGIEFTQPGGPPVSVFPDPYVQINTARFVDFSGGTFGLKSAGKLTQFLTLGGEKDMMMEESTNTFEGRIGGYSNTWCKRPLNLGRLQLA